MTQYNPHIGRLTEREREALSGWLEHKTAKEIARDLGVSHHAVEKRLKMARTKLGVSTSLQAARLLAESEGYDLAVAGSPDLPTGTETPHHRFTRPLIMGVSLVIILTAATALLVSQASTTQAAQTYQAMEESQSGFLSDYEYVSASQDRVEAYVQQMFDRNDKDSSGFLERGEMQIEVISTRSGGEPTVTNLDDIVKEMSGDEAEAEFFARFDSDGDGRLSPEEYAVPVQPPYLQRGIPLVPADRPVGG